MSGFFDDIEDSLDAQKKADEEAFDAPKFDPEPGDQLQGVFLKAEAFTKGKYEPTVLLTFRNVGDETIGGVEAGATGVMFTPTVLRRKLMEAQPAMGTPFALRFEGSIVPEKGGNPYKDWTLLTAYMKGADTDTLDVELWKAIREVVDGGDRAGSRPQRSTDAGDGDWKF